MLASSVR